MTPIKTIDKVNELTLQPGNNVYFRRGDTFIGTLTPSQSGAASAYINYGAYGSGNDPIITPNVIHDLSWDYLSDGIYYTTDIPYSPGNILFNDKKIGRIHDDHFEIPIVDFENKTSLEIMALPATYKFTFGLNSFSLWDVNNALFCYDSVTGRTYIRFKNNLNPNTVNLKIAANNQITGGCYINNIDYIKISNINFYGGTAGIFIIDGGFERDFNTIIVEDCNFINCNYKIWVSSTSGVTIRRSKFTNNYYSDYTCGAWQFKLSSHYKYNVNEGIYRFYKVIEGAGDSSIDGAIVSLGGYSNNCRFNDNIITNCCEGIICYGSNVYAYDNNISHVSSVGISLAHKAPIYAHGNTLSDCNFIFRVNALDETTHPDRVYYIYNNKVYNPIAGSFIYLHSYNTAPSSVIGYVYHNSIISSAGVGVSGYLNMPPAPTGFVFINNILSTPENICYGWAHMSNYADLFVWYYNWASGGFYGSASAVWAEDESNINQLTPTIWDHSIDPPEFEIEGTVAEGTGIDLSEVFVLDSVEYNPMPGINYGINLPNIGCLN